MALSRQFLAFCALSAVFAHSAAALADASGSIAEDVIAPPRGMAGVVQEDASEADPETDAELLDYDPLFDEEEEGDALEREVFDPFEPGNRAIYRFNRQVSRFVWDPVTTGYRFVVPTPARRAVRRVFDNLNAPIYVANHLLQLDPLAAVETLGAFGMNVTFGVGGLFDTASGAGLELKATDFGQTLALAGVGAGPYLMFPLLGPTTLRDGFGFVIDRGFHPATYFFGIPMQLVGYGGVGFAALEESHDDLAALEDSALDPYAVLRSAYMQARERAIDELRGPRPAPAPVDTPGASLASGVRNL